MGDLSILEHYGLLAFVLYVVGRDITPIFRRWAERKNGNGGADGLTVPPRSMMTLHNQVSNHDVLIRILSETCERLEKVIEKINENVNHIMISVAVLEAKAKKND